MGACDGRTQGAPLAALAGRLRTPQRACPARSGGPCSFCWSFLEPETLERGFVAAPMRTHLDHQLEVDRVTEQLLDLGAGLRADLLDHGAAFADDDVLLRLGLDEHVCPQDLVGE